MLLYYTQHVLSSKKGKYEKEIGLIDICPESTNNRTRRISKDNSKFRDPSDNISWMQSTYESFVTKLNKDIMEKRELAVCSKPSPPQAVEKLFIENPYTRHLYNNKLSKITNIWFKYFARQVTIIEYLKSCMDELNEQYKGIMKLRTRLDERNKEIVSKRSFIGCEERGYSGAKSGFRCLNPENDSLCCEIKTYNIFMRDVTNIEKAHNIMKPVESIIWEDIVKLYELNNKLLDNLKENDNITNIFRKRGVDNFKIK